MLWVHSSAKALTEKNKRQKKIKDCSESLKKLVTKLNSYHLKTYQEIELAVQKALSGTKDYFSYQILEETQMVKKQNKRGLLTEPRNMKKKLK